MKDAIEEHQRGEESRSAAVRRVLRWGLEEAEPAQDRRPLAVGALVAGAAYIGAYLIGSRDALVVIGGAFIAVALLWTLAPSLPDLS